MNKRKKAKLRLKIFTEMLNEWPFILVKSERGIIDKIIKLLDKYIAMDDDGCQWITIEFNELEEKIRALENDKPL